MHRIGGIEKEDGSGNISYTPENHEKMVHLRQAKIDGIARFIPPAVIEGDADADVIVVGWGSTWGAIGDAVRRIRATGDKIGWVHLMHLNPWPANLGELLQGRRRVLVPEMNLGQLCRELRARFLVDATSISKVQGVPFTTAELEAHFRGALS
jgi:2-oxoglutarate ferredoxin oxidoreductase subunit alpha